MNKYLVRVEQTIFRSFVVEARNMFAAESTVIAHVNEIDLLEDSDASVSNINVWAEGSVNECEEVDFKEDTEWEGYVKYLVDWANSHTGEEFMGMSPASFDEWCDMEYGECIE